MDHLPRVRNSAGLQIDVPYLHGEYDQKGFHGFVTRKGLSIAQVLNADYGDLPPIRVAAILQSWLYFAFLDEIISTGIEGAVLDGLRPRSHVNMNHFLTCRSGVLYISTKRLPEYLQYWRKSALRWPSERFRHSGLLIQKNLDFVRGYAMDFLRSKGRFWGKSYLPPENILALLILYRELSTFALNLYEGIVDGKILQWPDCDLLRERLRTKGWCQSRAQELETTYGPSIAYFLTTLTWPGLFMKHARYSEEICLADQVDLTKYKTKHFHEDCDCPFDGPDSESLLRIVNAENIPLIKITFTLAQPPGPMIEICSFDPTSESVPRYTAISHVWIDGLGNPTSNSLPLCQFLNLMFLGSETDFDHERTFLWIDTLCVPIDRKAKKIAIRSMRHVYKRADKVLVLDSSLMNVKWQDAVINAKRSSPTWEERRQDMVYVKSIETMARLCCSGWMRRLWTLQEAALGGSNLYLRFEDFSKFLLFDMKPIFDSELQTSSADHDRYEGIGYPLFKQYAVLEACATQPDLSDRLACIIMSVSTRSTSKYGDEAICLATLMGLDLKTIVDAPDEERMCLLLKMLEALPTGIAFSEGPRMRRRGLGWAPTSLLESDVVALSGEKPVKRAHRTDAGLIIWTTGFILDGKERKLNDLTFRAPQSPHGIFYGVIFDPKDSVFPGHNSKAEKGSTALSHVQSQMEQHCTSKVAFIVNPQHSSQLAEPSSLIPGLCAVVTNNSSGVIHTEVVCSVQVVVAYQSDVSHMVCPLLITHYSTDVMFKKLSTVFKQTRLNNGLWLEVIAFHQTPFHTPLHPESCFPPCFRNYTTV